MRLIKSSTLALALLVISMHARSEEALSTTVCKIIADPPAFNHKLVKLSGTVYQAMEKFSLSVESCGAVKLGNWTGIWVEYGGRVRTGAKYCCGIPMNRDRPTDLEIEGVQTSALFFGLRPASSSAAVDPLPPIDGGNVASARWQYTRRDSSAYPIPSGTTSCRE